MQAQRKRILKDGKQFDQYFPSADFKDTVTIKGKAGLEDTMLLIKEVLKKDQADTAKIARLLKGKTIRDSAKNTWNFVYDHIQYVLDRAGVEEIRRPARLWADRVTGGDCDCMSVFIGTILSNLGIPYTLRIAEYDKGYFQHIYPIVITDKRFYAERENRKYYIIVDCVKDAFDDEHPYKRIKDFDILNMDLAYLSGLGETDFDGLEATTELLGKLHGMGLSNAYDVDGLGRIRRRKGASAVPIPVPPTATAAPAQTAAPATQTQTQSPAAPPTPAEAKKFQVKRTHIYKLGNGVMVKLGNYTRTAGERFVLFKNPGQNDFIQNGVLGEKTFFVDNSDVCWGIATINNSFWKKYPTSGWQSSNQNEYNQAKPNAKAPLSITGYVLKDGTKIFLDKRAPRETSGYPVKWKSPDEESGWTANGLLAHMLVAENSEFVIGRNGQGIFFRSSGFTRWQQISEDEYMNLRQKALKGFNDVDAQFSMNGDGDLTLNAPSENQGLYIPYEVLEKLMKSKLDAARNYNGIAGIGFLLGDELLNAIEPLMGQDEMNGAENVLIGPFGETTILGTEGYYENVGDLAELQQELLGENSLLVADGFGRVRQKKAKRSSAPEAAADAKTAAKGPRKLGMYIPTHTLNLLLKWRNDNLLRLQNKGVEITRGEIPASISGLGNFFDVVKAPLKAVLSVAKFIPIPAISVAANIIDKVIPDDKPKSGSRPIQQVIQAADPAQQALQTENKNLKDQLTTHNQNVQAANKETSSGYDQSVQGLGGFTDIIGWVKSNPIKTGAIVLGGGLAVYELTKKSKTGSIGSFLGLSGKPTKRKRRKKLKVIRL